MSEKVPNSIADSHSSIYSESGFAPFHLDKNVESDLLDNIGGKLPTANEYWGLAEESLSVEPIKRSDSQIDSICYMFMELESLKNMSYDTKLKLARVAKLASFEPKDIIASRGQEIDSFNIILSGDVVFNEDTKPSVTLATGDTFGPVPDEEERLTSSGFYTTFNGCDLITVNVIELKDLNSDPVPAETEDERSDIEGSYVDKILISGNVDVIVDTLFERKYYETEPSFVSDFFLTFKIYLTDTTVLVKRIRDSVCDDYQRQRATSILLAWLIHVPEDFETEFMKDFIEFVIDSLRTKGISMLIEAIVDACYMRSLSYEFHFSVRPDEDIPFRFKYRIVTSDSKKQKFELFVSSVKSGTKNCGLQLYDEILFLNDFCVKYLTLQQVRTLIRTSSMFIAVVKRCIIKYKAFKDSLYDLYDMNSTKSQKLVSETEIDSSFNYDKYPGPKSGTLRHGSICSEASVDSQRGSLLKRFTLRLSKKNTHKQNITPETSSSTSSTSSLRDLMSVFTQKNLNYDNIQENLDGHCLDLAAQINSHFVFRIYTSNDEVKYLQISRMDSCQKIVEEFLNQIKSKKAPQIHEASQAQDFPSFSYLFSAKITASGVKVSRLPISICNLPSMSVPGVRYYVTECSSDVKISTEIERSMRNECSTEILNFNHLAFAKLLTFFNFYKFTRISPKEYLASIFKAVKFDSSNLNYFEHRCDQELNWVVGSILAESNNKERVNLIVHFIKIARDCLDLNNFNSFFSIVQGLEHTLISRLKSTWDLVPSKFVKMLHSLSEYCDPSQNMTNYRTWLLKCMIEKSREHKNVVIPFIPLVKKDLTFINDSMETFVSHNQINYRKMRAVAKELRKISYFLETNFKLSKMFETPYKVPSYLLAEPSLSIGPYQADHSIMLSDVTREILNFVRFDKLISSNENLLSSYYYQNIWKKIYDESISTKKIMDYVSRIDSLRFDMEKLRSKSFEYEPSKRVVSKSFANDELSSGTIDSMRSSKYVLAEEIEVPGSPSGSTSSLNNTKTTVFKKSDSQDGSSGYGTLV